MDYGEDLFGDYDDEEDEMEMERSYKPVAIKKKSMKKAAGKKERRRSYSGSDDSDSSVVMR